MQISANSDATIRTPWVKFSDQAQYAFLEWRKLLRTQDIEKDDFPEGYVKNLENAGSTVNIEERKKAFKKVQEIMLDSCIDIPISWKYTLFAKQKNVNNFVAGWTKKW